MQSLKKIELSEGGQAEGAQDGGAGDRLHLTHKRLDRWIRLQQFVYGLPDDYSYAVVTSSPGYGRKCESHALVKVGWMSWYGYGRANERQHSLAVALLETSEALSANSSTVYLHQAGRWLKQLRDLVLRKRPRPIKARESGRRDEPALLAG